MNKFMNGVVLICLGGILTFNFMHTIHNICDQKIPMTAANHYPGEAYVKMLPYLKDKHLIGYVTNYNPPHWEADRAVTFNYHQIKYALAPTILDRNNPWDQEYVLLCFFNPEIRPLILVPWPARIAAKVNNNLILLQRIHS